MKKIIIPFLLGCLLGAPAIKAEESFLNLTPAPKSVKQAAGTFDLKNASDVSSQGLDEAMTAELNSALEAINSTTGLKLVATDAAVITNFNVSKNATLAAEGYKLNVTADGVTIEAATPAGLFYAFQTVKKLLPANVMAGIAMEGDYQLPLVEIDDEPRLGYRGFMLDVCRHFFTVDEVKRVLDVMAYYKMNKFHWHLTEDQGWRIEMPEWPRLTTVGATAPNCTFTDYKAKTEYWINSSYGPFFYSTDELKEVVDYAAKLHIDVIPEVELPGHFSAVNTAYPELSCWPDGAHSVAVTGGVYSDVLNVASPLAEKFYQDVIDHLVEIFPYEMIHIGGDECPTSAWQNNADCQALVEQLGLTGDNNDQKFRKLQSWFTKKVSDYAASKGRKIACWNESITAGGTDLDVIKQTGATIYCWVGADNAVNVGVNNGLPVIYTPITGPAAGKGSFYINRRQDPNDPPANGNTWDTVDKVYNTTPFTDNAIKNHLDLCQGVQGTFWTERVSDREYLEWLALPRLLAIAEIGWTPEANKDWTSFQKRMSLDRELLDLRDYKYSHHKMLDYEAPDWTKPAGSFPAINTPADGTYVFENTTNGLFLSDNNTTQTLLGNSGSAWDNNIWQLSGAQVNSDNSVSITLTNLATGRKISTADNYNDPAARAVRLGDSAADNLKIAALTADASEIKLMLNGFTLWPIPSSSTVNPSTVTSGNNKNADHDASEMQPIGWKLIAVTPTTYVCKDTEGNEIFSGVRGLAADADAAAGAPEIKNFKLKSTEQDADGTVNCVYERIAVSITTRLRLENGALIAAPTEVTVAPGETVIIKHPEVSKYFTYKETLGAPESFSAATDVEIDVVYSTEAIVGVKEPVAAVETPQTGVAYLIHDDHSARNAYRYADSKKKITGTWTAYDRDPYFVWTLEEKGAGYSIKNVGWNLYAQAVKQNEQGTVAKTAREYKLMPNGTGWTIQNAANDLAWDGQENLNMVGWTAPGHPYSFVEFIAEPYFMVTLTKVDTEGNKIGTDSSTIVKAGSEFSFEVPTVNKYEFEKAEGHESGATVEGNTTVTLTYKSTESAINEVSATTDGSTRIYDLQGRRLSAPVRGINIINGRKVKN